MAESKNTFLKSKMNKDLDNRLMPPGEYRDAQNISISRSEDSDVGASENVLGNELTGRDLILVCGGLFLIFKSTIEIHNHLEGEKDLEKKIKVGFANIIFQIVLLDIIFSLDSVITAIGLVDELNIMIIAIVIAIIFMMIFINTISTFIEEHPTIKILALSFLLLIGIALIGDGLGMHIPKGYIYFAMAFSTFVEMVNLKLYKRKKH